MGHIADIVLRDFYPSTEKSIFDVVDSQYIYEVDGQKILSVTDELIDELVNSDIPNRDFLSAVTVEDKNGESYCCYKYSSIIRNRVLARRNYPRIKDVAKDIFFRSALSCENIFDGIEELRKTIKTIPKKLQADYIKEYYKEFRVEKWNFRNYELLYSWIEYMRINDITKTVFGDDELWERIANVVKEKRNSIKEAMKRGKNVNHNFQVKYNYYNNLVKFMENNE